MCLCVCHDESYDLHPLENVPFIKALINKNLISLGLNVKEDLARSLKGDLCTNSNQNYLGANFRGPIPVTKTKFLGGCGPEICPLSKIPNGSHT